MRHITHHAFVCVAALTIMSGCASSSSPQVALGQLDNVLTEASCGQCQFGMEGDGCDLAVRIDGRAYYVDGTTIDEHGDAHADSGFCNAIRQARVSGTIEHGRFHATSFEVLPASEN